MDTQRMETHVLKSNLTEESNSFTPIGLPVFLIDDRQRIISAICYLVAAILGIMGNSLVIFSVFASKKLWSTNNVFVVNLSVADLLTCLSIIWSVFVMLSPLNIQYPIPDLLCAAASTGISTTFGCSIYTLASIAINRLDGIIRPTKIYKLNYTFWMGLWVFVTWLIPFLATIVPPLLGFGTLGTDSFSRTCSVDIFHPLQKYQAWAQVFVFYPIPLPTICICYLIIFIYLQRHTNQMVKTVAGDESARAIELATSMRKRQVTVTKNMFYVIAIFVLLLTPYGLSSTLLVRFLPQKVGTWHLYLSTLVVFNSCVNPFLYGFKHPTFKEVFKYLLSCRWKNVPEQSDAFKRMRKRLCSTRC